MMKSHLRSLADGGLTSAMSAPSFVSKKHSNSISQHRMPGLSTMQLAIQALLTGMLSMAASAQAQERTAVYPETGIAQRRLPDIHVQARKESLADKQKKRITSEEMAARNVISMADIVRYEPLISVPAALSGSGNIWDGAGSTGFHIRGIEGNRIGMDLDGIAMPEAAPKPDGVTLNSFASGREYVDVETLRAVQIGYSAADGSGLGGGVSFASKSPSDFVSQDGDRYASYRNGYQSVNRSQFHTLTGATQSGNWQGMAIAVYRKGQEASSKGDVPVNPDQWHSSAVLAKLAYQATATQKYVFTLDGYERNHERQLNNKQGGLYPDGAAQDSVTRRQRISLEHSAQIDSGWLDSINSQIYWQDAKVSENTQARYLFGGKAYQRQILTSFDNNSYGVSTQLMKQWTPQHQTYVNVQASHTSSKRPWLEDRTVLATGAHQITSKNRMADMDTDQLALTVKDEQQWMWNQHRISLTPSLRADYRKLKPVNLQQYVVAVPAAAREIRTETDTVLTPAVELAIGLGRDLDVYAQYKHGNRLPSAAERTGTFDSFSYTGAGNGYAVLGNSRLKKESSDAAELGLRGSPVRGWQLRSALFYTRYHDFIEYVAQAPDPVNYPSITFGLYRPENIGEVTTRGIEASSRIELGAWAPALTGYALDLAAGYTRGDALNQKTGQRAALASVAPAKFSAGLNYDDPAGRFGIAVYARHVAGKQAPDDVISGIATARFAVPAYSVVDVSSWWRISQQLRVQAAISNLADRKYWDYASARGLAAGTTAAALADIERQAQPGRHFSVSMNLSF